MSALIYIHGFLSAPQSYKAQATKHWLEQQRSDIQFHCPYLSSYPKQSRQQLEELVQSLLPEPIYLIGSSMGGFWATYLVEKYHFKAVLINPAVSPQEHFPQYVGQALKNYYTDDETMLGSNDMDDLIQADTEELQDHTRYWLMVQTGDETLDYRLAVAKYYNARQWVEEGGNHSFENYSQWLPEIIKFLEN